MSRGNDLAPPLFLTTYKLLKRGSIFSCRHKVLYGSTKRAESILLLIQRLWVVFMKVYNYTNNPQTLIFFRYHQISANFTETHFIFSVFLSLGWGHVCKVRFLHRLGEAYRSGYQVLYNCIHWRPSV